MLTTPAKGRYHRNNGKALGGDPIPLAACLTGVCTLFRPPQRTDKAPGSTHALCSRNPEVAGEAKRRGTMSTLIPSRQKQGVMGTPGLRMVKL
jgi:hypothetical protein